MVTCVRGSDRFRPVRSGSVWFSPIQSGSVCFGPVQSGSDLLLVGQLLVLLGQDLGQVQVAHLRVDFGVFGSFLHEEAKVRSQGFLGEIWMSLNRREGGGEQIQDQQSLLQFSLTQVISPSVSFPCKGSSQTRWRPR